MRRRGLPRLLAPLVAGSVLCAGCASQAPRPESAAPPPQSSQVPLSLLEQLGGGHPGKGSRASPASSTALGRLWLGAAWYPEQWPQSTWDRDLSLMQAAGINVVRVGEFAWSRLEPAEGQYQLEWLARAIRMAQRHHIAVVIGTPTDAPPAWLTSRYPQVLSVGPDGRRAEHGGRRQFSYSSPLYRQFCRDIVTRLAQRFGHDADVIGWQIDNEYTDESYDPATRAQFQRWLQSRFGTLEALNRAWTTAYWSQTYTAWSQIPLNALPGNPGLMLAHRHFVTHTWRSYQRNQIAALRPHIAPGQFITSNFGGLGWSDNWDHYALAQDLDLASWDDYVGQGHLDAYRNGAISDFVRGWKRRDYWVMEAQPGFVDWAPISNSLDEGEVRAMTWQSIGHGADAVLFWQWQSALNGQEQYHGTLVGPDGEPVPLYREVLRIGREFRQASAAIAGTAPESRVAILTTYDSRWAIDFQRHCANYRQQQVLLDFYHPLEDLTHSVDVVSAYAPLSRYKVVVAPGLNVIPQKLARRLAAYVRGGGYLILGPRSGMKDRFDRLDVRRQPGPLAAVLGGRVQQYYALDSSVAVSGPAGMGEASIWAEALQPLTRQTRVILRYAPNSSWLSSQPAALSRPYGRGEITYLGALLDPRLMRGLLRQQLAAAGVTSAGPLPPDVELMRRYGAGREITILINHGASPRTITLPDSMRDLLHPGVTMREVVLGAQGVAVLERPEARPTAR
ncbi:MAG TPA: beta-galactosidase [Steroidobacteraceae bacterium]|nr:beta-galactosidase [Steroidobacteraceae bacterium]